MQPNLLNLISIELYIINIDDNKKGGFCNDKF